MRSTYRDIVRHSGVYAIGGILARIPSVLLLPIYTQYLRPGDYGVIAILDLMAGLLTSVVGSGLVAAVGRHHFDDEDERRRASLWWTGALLIAAVASAIVFPAWLGRGALANLLLGPSAVDGVLYVSLMLPTMWLGLVGQLPDAYIRVRKWSGISVTLNLGRLLVNIAFNLYFLIVLDLGVTGILLGNLLASALMTAVAGVFLAGSLKRSKLQWAITAELWRFAAPLFVTAFLSIILHEGDRYLLRLFQGIDQVGIYSLGYTLSQAVNSLVLIPFAAIWAVLIYEIAAQAESKEVFARVFLYHSYVTQVVMLGVSILAEPVIRVLAAPDFQQAASVVPIVCLGYIFFGLNEHFRVPVMLAKRTRVLPPVFLLAVIVNLVANLVLIPIAGFVGAAWATVVGFIAFAFVGLWRYRKIDRYPYPLGRFWLVLTAMVASFVAWRLAAKVGLPEVAHLGLGAVIWLLWAVALLARPLWQIRSAWWSGGSRTVGLP